MKSRNGIRTVENADSYSDSTFWKEWERIFTLRHEWVVARDNTVRFANQVLQLLPLHGVTTLTKRRVEMREHLDGVLELFLGK